MPMSRALPAPVRERKLHQTLRASRVPPQRLSAYAPGRPTTSPAPLPLARQPSLPTHPSQSPLAPPLALPPPSPPRITRAIFVARLLQPPPRSPHNIPLAQSPHPSPHHPLAQTGYPRNVNCAAWLLPPCSPSPIPSSLPSPIPSSLPSVFPPCPPCHSVSSLFPSPRSPGHLAYARGTATGRIAVRARRPPTTAT